MRSPRSCNTRVVSLSLASANLFHKKKERPLLLFLESHRSLMVDPLACHSPYAPYAVDDRCWLMNSVPFLLGFQQTQASKEVERALKDAGML